MADREINDCYVHPFPVEGIRRSLPQCKPPAPVSLKVSDHFSPLLRQVDELELKASQLGEMVATLQVNFGSEIGRIAKIADPSHPPLKQLLTVLEHLHNKTKA